jgi:hypothetical protein
MVPLLLGGVYEWVFIERAGLNVPDFTYWQYVLIWWAWRIFRGGNVSLFDSILGDTLEIDIDE